MISRKIQEESLRTYIFTHAPFYASLSLSHLSTTFSLPRSTVLLVLVHQAHGSLGELLSKSLHLGRLDAVEDDNVVDRVASTPRYPSPTSPPPSLCPDRPFCPLSAE
jgi:hypothetical protein